MPEPDWLHMLSHQQELHHFARALLLQSQKKTLTASELELLSLLYLQPEGLTPHELSQQSGMKKEAVSRSLKGLFAKGCVAKTVHPQDERSYILTLTAVGSQELGANYGPMLQPLYRLRRAMGPEFEQLFGLVIKANRLLAQETD